MICKHCLKEATENDPFGYCAQCSVWYIAEGEEISGVYLLCSTKDDDPEKCDPFVQSLIPRMEKLPDSGEIPIAQTGLNNSRKADKICASCANKHFVLTKATS